MFRIIVLMAILLGGLWSTNALSAECQTITCQEELAEQFAPILRFDSKQGNKNKCFPGDAAEYYKARQSGDTSRICNEDYSSVTSGNVPTYYQYASNGFSEYIVYWFFYGWQDSCSPGVGTHDADWERIVVKLQDRFSTGNRAIVGVLFYQHKGQYSKLASYESEGDHPIVYVGKNSHGSYHDSGGTGTCCYWEDFRKPGSKNQRLETWHNLVRLVNNNNAPEWMRYEKSWDDWGADDGKVKGPLMRGEDLTRLKSCKGALLKTCGTSGCAKSFSGTF